MGKGRLEAFSDGVFAIIITIMVLELRVPVGGDLSSLKPLLPVFLSYVLSFTNVGIYWNNHHHLFQAVDHINGRVLWLNLLLLFWLSLFPFMTGWMGENHFNTWPVAFYGIVSFMCGMAYFFLAHSLLSIHDQDSKLVSALRSDRKEKLSVLIYIAGIGLSFVHPMLGIGCYVLVAGMWFIPDSRFEKTNGNSK
jgi:uncharacterized membrane protein